MEDNNKFKNRKQQELTTKNKKIELYGSPTTKELKKKHSSRPVGGAETGSQVKRTHHKVAEGQGGGWWNP